MTENNDAVDLIDMVLGIGSAFGVGPSRPMEDRRFYVCVDGDWVSEDYAASVAHEEAFSCGHWVRGEVRRVPVRQTPS